MMEDRQRAIFEAIRELLEESEVEGVTVAAIAERCHLHASTVSYYFHGKADMMMRFHAYVTNVRTSGLPELYYTVPAGEAAAVKALSEIVDLELFRVDYSTRAQRRLYLYLFGNMLEEPGIRDYLAGNELAYTKFLRGVLQKYVKAGVANEGRLEEALNGLILVSCGYTILHYIYGDIPPDVLEHERRRLIFALVAEKYHPQLQDLLN